MNAIFIGKGYNVQSVQSHNIFYEEIDTFDVLKLKFISLIDIFSLDTTEINKQNEEN